MPTNILKIKIKIINKVKNMKIYNTLTKRKEDFVPINRYTVKMYLCGPTVYDHAHLGHGRTYVVFDTIRRYLEHKNYIVRLIMNFTDIDDKIISRSNREGISVKDLADKYIRSFLQDMEKLYIKPAEVYPRVSEHIEDIIAFIEVLIKKGYAYVSKDGVYFDVKRFKDYGKLSNIKLNQMDVGHRVEKNLNKRNPEDFALWKFAKPNEPQWDSPWGKGRPGWHTECSVMGMKYLGEQFDIHGGGSDLIFPHHENEIAQSEAYIGRSPWVRYWLHSGFLTINNEKMSKSLGNFITLKEVLKKYHPEVVRFFLLQRHYRSPIEYTEEGLIDAEAALNKLYNTLKNIDAHLRDSTIKYKLNDRDRFTNNIILDSWNGFYVAMDDDFNTPEALKYVFEVSSEVNRYIATSNELNKNTLLYARKFFSTVGEVFGIFNNYLGEGHIREDSLDGKINDLINILIDVRGKLKKEKNYNLADEIRDNLKKIGIQLEDTPRGTLCKKL